MASGITYVAEFVDCGFIGRNGKTDALIFPAPTVVQVITCPSSGAGSSVSSAFNSSTNVIRVHADSSNAVCIGIGTAPVAASSNSLRIAPNATEYFTVPLGGGSKIATIFVT